MKVRRYEAGSYREALAQVREDLGPDAVILATRELSRGGLFGLFSRAAVEVVAASSAPATRKQAVPRQERREVPEAPAAYGRYRTKSGRASRVAQSSTEPSVLTAGAPAPLSPPPAEASLDERLDRLEARVEQVRDALEQLARREPEASVAEAADVPAVFSVAHRRLTRNGVPAACAAEFLRGLDVRAIGDSPSDDEVAALVRRELCRAFATSGPLLSGPERAGGRLVALIGPTGVGKTTTLAKLAARHALLEDRRVGLLTMDTYRVAAVDQLRTFAQIMDIPLEVASRPEEARSRLSSLGARDLILVDTAGRSHNARERLTELSLLMRAIEPDEIHLVMSATTKPEDMLAVGREFGTLGANRLLFTKLDETASYGGLMVAVRATRLPVSYLTNGQKVPEDIEVAMPERLADLVLGAWGEDRR